MALRLLVLSFLLQNAVYAQDVDVGGGGGEGGDGEEEGNKRIFFNTFISNSVNIR